MKRKIILALLASLCVAASAAGIAACSSKNSGTAHDPALYAAYQKYVESTDDPVGYEEWLEDILDKFYGGGEQGSQGNVGDTGDSIKTWKIVTINEKEYYEFTFTSGRIIRLSLDGEDRQETTAFAIKAVDAYGEPIANAYFSIGYYDSAIYIDRFIKEDGTVTTNAASAYVVQSDENGNAIFNTFLSSQAEREYSVYIADPSAIGGEGSKSGIPDGYRVDFGYTQIGDMVIAKNSAPFAKNDDFSYSVTVKFLIDNSWSTLYDENNDLQYSRYVKSGETKITEAHTPYVKSAQKGKYNYFTLMPFPYHLINEIDMGKSYKAAEGVYRVTWTASDANADVELYLYDFYVAPQVIKTNSDGSPADSHVTKHSGSVPTDQTLLQQRYNAYTNNDGMLSYGAWLADYSKTFSGSNYVDVEITENTSAVNCCLAYIADTDCDVTITVERIGDAATWTTVSNTVDMPSNAPKAQDNTEGRRMMHVPLDKAIYRDANGNYHLDSVTGPMIYVQLKNATRVNSYSMVYLAHYKIETDGDEDPYRTQFNYYTEEFNEETNSGVRTFTDYTKVVLGYGELANKDGLYPVNDLLKTILEEFCRGYSDSDNYWVAACSYYGYIPAGTEDAPYEVNTAIGGNTITLKNGSAYVYFSSSKTGYYGFYSEDGKIEGIEGGILVEGVARSTNNGTKNFDIIYVEIAALSDIKFKVTKQGSSTANVTVIALVDGNFPALKYDDSNADVSTPALGTEGNPISAKAGALQVTVDLDKYDGYIEVNVRALPIAEGNYTINVFGSSTAIIVDENGNNLIGQTIYLSSLSSGQIRIRITDIKSGTFIINFTPVK
ncbi:MAG: hypothetical protein J1F61_02165 [Clostridiales bacterium]|nr:hypothetical protein [Clostridiales bacterium]